jgi:transcriptional regulator with XRE-family HTH domain
LYQLSCTFEIQELVQKGGHRVTIGRVFAEGRKRAGLSQKDLSEKEDVNYSKEAIQKFEQGTRTYPKPLYPKTAGAIDDPQTYFEVWEETAGYVSLPYFDGDFITHKSSDMVLLVKKETKEALFHVKETPWFQSPESRTEQDLENIQKTIAEILDSAASMVNLVAAICKENDLSMKAVFRQWRVSLKARKYEK